MIWRNLMGNIIGKYAGKLIGQADLDNPLN
jgi:hypothetical protein